MAEWQLEPAVAAGLETLGWRSDEPAVRDVVPPVLRGSNAVAVMPPAPAWATPVLAALVGHHPAQAGGVLILAAPAMLAEWTLAAGALLERTSLQVSVARETRGGGDSRPRPTSNLLIASPESALEQHSRSALHPEQFRAIVFAWPEQWQSDDAVAALLQDLPKDAQRVVLTSQPDRLNGSDGLIERYARKALVLGGATVDANSAPATPRAPIRTVPVTWGGRAAAAAAAIAAIDPVEAPIWTADLRDHQLIRRTIGSMGPGLALSARSAPKTGIVICYDLPAATELASLGTAGELVLLVPPGGEQYVARVATHRRPMQLRSAAAAVAGRDGALRQQIATSIEAGMNVAALYALAPLFEEHDPQEVAAAVFTLWREAAANRAPAAQPAAIAVTPAREMPSPESGNPAVAKIWIGAGKKDDATVADFVAVLVREVGVDRGRIGRIELRDTFALVEVPAADAAAIVHRLSGITIRKRKLTARVDQGRGGGTPKRR